MKTKIIGNYQLISCTAIAISAESTERQDAILCRSLDSCPGDADSVIFGYGFDDLDTLDCLDGCATSALQDDLDTVLIDDFPIEHYVSGEL